MKGKYLIEIYSKRINYKLNINRNITIIKGDSSTGKTRLLKIIEDSIKNNSNIKINSDVKVSVLPNDRYELILRNTENEIIFIDESHIIFKDIKFSKLIKESDNYFIFITRDKLDSLPYSYKEVYKLKYDKKTNMNYNIRVYDN